MKALRTYIESQGASKSSSMVSSDKLWAFNRSVLETSAPRFMALASSDSNGIITAIIEGITQSQLIDIAVNPTDASQGRRKISVGPRMFVECTVALSDLQIGSKVNLISWQNFALKSVDIAARSIVLQPLPEDKDFKSATKMNYVDSSRCTKIICNTYGNLITKSVVTKDDDFKDFVNSNSLCMSQMVGEEAIKALKQLDHLQIYRHGFFIVDQPYDAEKDCVVLNKVPE